MKLDHQTGRRPITRLITRGKSKKKIDKMIKSCVFFKKGGKSIFFFYSRNLTKCVGLDLETAIHDGSPKKNNTIPTYMYLLSCLILPSVVDRIKTD